MIELDVLWGKPRKVDIKGLKRPSHVPFGVTTLQPDVVDFISAWIKSSGVQWTAKRVKALKVWAIQILAGNKDYSEAWFQVVRYKGYKVPKLRLFQLLVDAVGNNLKVIRSVLLVLNSYKLVTVGSPSLTSIIDVEPSTKTEHYARLTRMYVDLPTIPEEVLDGELAVSSQRKFCDNEGRTFNGPIGQPDPLPQWNNSPEMLKHFVRTTPYEVTCLGRLVPIIDKGKYRNILVGNQILQLATKKLADWLRRWLWSLPEVASGDQQKMTRFALENLQKGRFMLSIDLSEATDRLSKDYQIHLLTLMGLPKGYLGFLNLPFYFDPNLFGIESDKRLELSCYSNGQPMGLYLSFPMFELGHYVILKYAIATVPNASFCICGDDVMVSVQNNTEGKVVFERYKTLVEALGGLISGPKTLMSFSAAEGVGALFLKGYPKEIRIPSGKLSALEAYTKETSVSAEVSSLTTLGRALMVAWLQTRYTKAYTYEQRKTANFELVTRDLSHLNIMALRSLVRPDQDPTIYTIEDDSHYSFWMMNPIEKRDHLPYRLIGKEKFRQLLIDNKILQLIKEQDNVRKNKRR